MKKLVSAMSIEASLEVCEATVKRADPDRYLSALFAPRERRPLLFALYAFNHELARIGETVAEPMAAAIRLQWWREALEGARDGRPRAHDVARGLGEMFARAGPSLELFEPLLQAREFDFSTETFADLAELESYCDRTAGSLMRIAAHLLDEHQPDDKIFRCAGRAFALTGILRAFPYRPRHAARYLPAALVREAGKHSAVERIVACARAHHAAARSVAIARPVLPAVLPASLVPLYADRLMGAGENALKAPIDVPLYRRQWAMYWAAWRGRV